MCSRFFIDFPDLNQQQAKLENYLYNHFQSSEDQTKYHYLMILYQVVDESTVCLMGHERRLTLSLIEDMAFQVYTPPMPMNNYYNNKYNHGPATPNISDLNLLSPASSNSSASSTASCCSIGSCSNMSTTGSHYSLGSCSNMSTTSSSASSSNSSSASNSGTATPVMNTSPPPPPHAMVQHQPPPPPPPPATIPTYEIVTSCQPAVMYSNGFYYTSFVQHPAATHNHGQHHAQEVHHHQVGVPAATHAPCTPPTFTVQTVSPGQCLACSCGQWAASNVPQLQPQQS